ncbi:MAG: hypothetical protein K8I82_16415, partial [Anaerolineae bacterium]|nr:hypothetical protein [Anaerolineae bacterium]
MFSELQDHTQSLLMTILLILWAAFLFGGFILGTENAERTHRTMTWTRMASSLVLVVVGWVFVWITCETRVSTYALLIALGMTFGFLG